MNAEENEPRGRQVVEEIFGPDRYRETRLEAAPSNHRDLLELADEIIFARTYTRDGLDLSQRSLCTIAALTVLDRQTQLASHIKGALHLGIEPASIVEVIRQMAFYGGFPAALNAMRTADDCFAQAAEPNNDLAR